MRRFARPSDGLSVRSGSGGAAGRSPRTGAGRPDKLRTMSATEREDSVERPGFPSWAFRGTDRWFVPALAVMAAISLVVAVIRIPAVIAYAHRRLERAPSTLREADIAPLATTAPTAIYAGAARAI